MTREILFRAKRIDNGEWVEGGLFSTDKCDALAISEYEFDYSTICQYTGLTDKNGTKIFENDILLLSEVRYRVEWKDDAAQFVINKNGAQFPFDSYWECEVEVIGNIFDNRTAEDGHETLQEALRKPNEPI